MTAATSFIRKLVMREPHRDGDHSVVRSSRGTRLRRRMRRPVVTVVGLVLLAAACNSADDDETAPPSVPTTAPDPVAAAEERVAAAQSDVDEAQGVLNAAGEQFCAEGERYVEAIDRYGMLLTDGTATVGDVNTAGADLVEPREAVSAAADDVLAAKDGLAAAEQELAAAEAALAETKATASSVPVSSTTPASTTTTTLVPQATIDRVQRAEDDLAQTSQGITDSTPLAEATAEYNSAAFALEIAWLKLLADAGCFTDDQQARAVQQVTDYTVALQTRLQLSGYYAGEIDGIYGPQTVDAVRQLQADNGLRETGLVDAATAVALDEQVAEVNQQAAAATMTETAAVQTALTLTGFWSGPIDGQWTDELTNALIEFQTALGVAPTGAVDAATLAAFEQALTEARTIVTATTTSPTTVEPTGPLPVPPITTPPTTPLTTPPTISIP